MEDKNIHSVSGSAPTQIQQKPSIKDTEYESVKKNAEDSHEHAKKHTSFKQLLYTFFKNFPGIIKALLRTSPKKDKAETSAQQQATSLLAEAEQNSYFHAGLEDTYEKAMESLNQEIDPLYKLLPKDAYPDLDRQKEINAITLQYRFGKLTYDEAWEQLIQNFSDSQIDNLKYMLDEQKQIKETMETSTLTQTTTRQPTDSSAEHILKEAYQAIQKIPYQPAQDYSKPLPEEMCAHLNTGSTYEKELEKVHKDIDQLYTDLPEEMLDYHKAFDTTMLQYRFGKLTYDQALQQLKQITGIEDVDSHKDTLNKQQLKKQTMITPEEKQEADQYNKTKNILHSNQIHGSSNCQSFCNSVEYSLRGLGYSQVIGTKDQIDTNTTPESPSPVACWNIQDLQESCCTNFLFDVDPNEFRQSVHKGTQAGVSDSTDTTQRLNGERYILLKTDRTGGGGHFMNMIRFKSTGRFWIIDGQNLQMYPILHPDGTFTDEAKNTLGDRNLYAFRMDKISDDIFTEELEKSNSLMEKANEASPIVNIIEDHCVQIPSDGWQSIDKGVDYLYKFHEAQYQQRLQMYNEQLQYVQKGGSIEAPPLEAPELCSREKISEMLKKVISDAEWKNIPSQFKQTLNKQFNDFKTRKRAQLDPQSYTMLCKVIDAIAPRHLAYTLEEVVKDISKQTEISSQITKDILNYIVKEHSGWNTFRKNFKYIPVASLIKKLQKPD